jgi:small Trp-rich protein
MYLLGLGLVLLVMKYLAVAPVADLGWLWVLSPFALAVAWWAVADASGYTKRKAMEREDQRRQLRIDRQKDALGTSPKKSHR